MQRLQKSWKHTVSAWTTTGTCGSNTLPNAWCQPTHFLTVRFYSHNFGKCRKEQKAFEEKCPPSGWKADPSQAISNLPLHSWLPDGQRLCQQTTLKSLDCKDTTLLCIWLLACSIPCCRTLVNNKFLCLYAVTVSIVFGCCSDYSCNANMHSWKFWKLRCLPLPSL